MKKKIYTIIGGLVVLIIVIILFFSKKRVSVSPLTSPLKPTASPSAEILPNDLEYSQGLTELHNKYPWYSKLPIETKDYRIVYDFEKNSFRIRILTESSESLKNDALNKLRSIGVDTNTIPYYFIEK